MLCPTCDNVSLAMTDRQGIEIDYCPNCRGIWLDRGELDRLIERAESASAATASAHVGPAAPPRHDASYTRQHDDRLRGHHPDGHRKKHRKSLIGELFDF